MHYSIGEVSDITGIAASTLRYYDREGMFPTMERSSGGIRVFSRRSANAARCSIAGSPRSRRRSPGSNAPATCCATSAGTTTPPPKPAPRTPCGTSPTRPFRRTCAITASEQGHTGGFGDILRSPTRPIHEARPQDPFHPTLPASPDSDAS